MAVPACAGMAVRMKAAELASPVSWISAWPGMTDFRDRDREADFPDIASNPVIARF